MRRIAGYFGKNYSMTVEKNIGKYKVLGGTLLASAIASGLIFNHRNK